VLCQGVDESSKHLFIQCVYAQRVWSLCFKWIGIQSRLNECVLFALNGLVFSLYNVQHNDLKSHFENFHLLHVSNKHNLIWKGIWAAIVRCIWDHRNRVIFKKGQLMRRRSSICQSLRHGYGWNIGQNYWNTLSHIGIWIQYCVLKTTGNGMGSYFIGRQEGDAVMRTKVGCPCSASVECLSIM